MTLNEIFVGKVAKDVADNKPVAEIISTAKRIMQIQFCSSNNKGQITEKGLQQALSQLDEWSKLPEEKALSSITCRIERADNIIDRSKETAKKRVKEECLKAKRMAVQSYTTAG